MTSFNREELDSAIVVSKLGMMQYLEIQMPSRTYKVVVVNGVPVELSAFTTVLMRYLANSGSSLAVVDDSLKVFWRDIDYTGYQAPKIKSYSEFFDGEPNPSVLVLEAILGDHVDELIVRWGTKPSPKYDFLPMTTELHRLMRDYRK